MQEHHTTLLVARHGEQDFSIYVFDLGFDVTRFAALQEGLRYRANFIGNLALRAPGKRLQLG